MAMSIVANDLPGNSYTMHPAAGANLVDTPDRITDSVMIEINPVLKMRSMVVAGVMNGLEEITSEKNGKFARINPVIFIAFAGYQFVAPGLRDNEFLDLFVEVTIGGKEIEIKRFKGLGEMNADQLWETTMNPQARTLPSVRLDDAGEADRLFSILMGGDVEKRRNIIQDHALEVQNLNV